MDGHIDVITLAVHDLERSLSFYRDGLGLSSPGIIGSEFPGDETSAAGAVVMFELRGGLILALYPRTELAKDAAVPPGPPQAGEFSVGQLVGSRDEVDEVLARAEAAGATITDPLTIDRGGSTRATSAILMATSGRSSGTPSPCRPPDARSA